MYMFSTFILVLCMLGTGLDFSNEFSNRPINNLGPGLGAVASNYAAVTDSGKLILAIAMLLGRLEIFTLLILFTATFWRP